MKTIEDVLGLIGKNKNDYAQMIEVYIRKGFNPIAQEAKFEILTELKSKIKESQMERKEKPPLGIMPSFIWKEKRIEEIQEATRAKLDEIAKMMRQFI